MKIVIFDLDGVIVSTDELHYRAWKQIADQEGIYFDRSINHRLRGVNRASSLEIILERANRTYSHIEKEVLMTRKNQLYVNSLNELSEKDILPGVLDVLKELKMRNVKIAIGSSSKNAKIILEKIGLIALFDYISDGTMIKRSKPEPDVFLNVSNFFNLNPENCIVVEDAKSGIEAAKAAKMMALAVGDAINCPLADGVLHQMIDLLEFVKGD